MAGDRAAAAGTAAGPARSHPLRRVNGYSTRSGTCCAPVCAWRLVPHDLAWHAAYRCFGSWTRQGVWADIHDALRDQVRTAAGRNHPHRSRRAIHAWQRDHVGHAADSRNSTALERKSARGALRRTGGTRSIRVSERAHAAMSAFAVSMWRTPSHSAGLFGRSGVFSFGGSIETVDVACCLGLWCLGRWLVIVEALSTRAPGELVGLRSRCHGPAPVSGKTRSLNLSTPTHLPQQDDGSL